MKRQHAECSKIFANDMTNEGLISKVYRRYRFIGAPQVALVVKNPLANAGDMRDLRLIPEQGRSPGGGRGNPLQYSCLKNPIERELAGCLL